MEIPTHEERGFESVLFWKYDGKCAKKFHSDGNTAMIRSDSTSGRAELEADTMHVAMVPRGLGLEKATPVVTLVARRPESEALLLLAGAKPLNAEDTTLYRSITMRVNSSSLDRPDFSFSARSLTRVMKSSTTEDFDKLERVGRYLGVLEVFCNADHAGHTSPVLEWQVCGVTLDQGWERGAKHHRVERWRV